MTQQAKLPLQTQFLTTTTKRNNQSDNQENWHRIKTKENFRWNIWYNTK